MSQTLSASESYSAEVKENTAITLTATPAQYYHLDALTVGNNAAFESGKSFTLTANTAVSATFARNTFLYKELTIRGKGAVVLKLGETVIEKGQQLPEGETVTVTLTPAEKFKVKNFSFEGLEKKDENTYIVTGEVILSADFEPIKEDGKPGGTTITPPVTPVDATPVAHCTVSPNPCEGYLHVEGISSTTVIRIYSAAGVLVFSRTIQPEETISTDRLPAGVYLLRVNGQTLRFVKK